MNNTWIVYPQYNVDHIALVPVPTFEPWNVPEIANGFWWHPALDTNLGSSSFAGVEGNGTGLDFAQVTVASQPTSLTENGSKQYRMRRNADANPSPLITSARAVNWTGATYVAMWIRVPSGDVTGTNNFFLHGNSGGNQRISLVSTSGTPDLVRLNLFSDGSTVFFTTAASPFSDGGWHWIEAVFDPDLLLGGSAASDRAKLYSDLTLLTSIATASNPTTIFNPTSSIRCNASIGGGSGADNFDRALIVYGNGLPNLGNRRLLAGYRPPTEVTF